MTAPRWIAEALEASLSRADAPGNPDGILAAALIERLPLEAMVRAIAMGSDGPELIRRVVQVLTDGDPEVVQLTELYQGACKVLDGAGVPYAQSPSEGQDAQPIDLAGRIRWLAQQRPTRLELQRVEAERDQARGEMSAVHGFLRSAHEALDAAGVAQSPSESQHMLDSALGRRVRALAYERDQLRKMYEGASADLDRERTRHQEDLASRDAEIVKLAAERDAARNGREALNGQLTTAADDWTKVEDAIRALVESDMPAGELRRALAELIGGPGARVELERVDRANASMTEKLRAAEEERDRARARVREFEVMFPTLTIEKKIGLMNVASDQAAYIEALESEIDALEDEIWQGEP